MLEAFFKDKEFTFEGEVDEYDLAKAEMMMIGYKARWGKTPKPIAVEQKFEVPLINPQTNKASRTYKLAGKIDMIAEVDGEPVIVEHKTSSADISLGSDYWSALKLDQQIGIYYVGAKALGYDVHKCIYDVLKKPAFRKSKKDTCPDDFAMRIGEAIAKEPDKYYRRGDVVRLEQEEHDARFDLWNQAKMIRESELIDRWPRNPNECLRFGRCTYFEVCTGMADIEDPYKFRVARRKHEEL